MNREEMARGLLAVARELAAAQSFNPGDYIMQPHSDSPIYGRVIEELKNGGYKAVLVGGWSQKPAIKSTKGAYPDFELIKESDVPDKFRKGIARKFPRIASSLVQGPMALSTESSSAFQVARDIDSLSSKVYDVLVERKRRGRMDRKQVEAWLRGVEEKARSLSIGLKEVRGLASELRDGLDEYGFEEK